MGTSRSAAQFVGKIRAAGQAIERARTEALRDVGKDMQDAARKAASADLGGDPKFSGWTVELATTVKVSSDSVTLTPKGRAVGPWKVATYGRHPGQSGHRQEPAVPKVLKSGNYSQRRQRFSKWNGSTQPKNTWPDAVNDIAAKLPKKISTKYSDALGKVF